MVFNSDGTTATFRGIMLTIVVGIMLLVGLNPKDLRLHNDVSRPPGSAGLEFGRQGIAFTEPLVSAATAAAVSLQGMTTEIVLELDEKDPAGFGFLALFHNGDDQTQWILGQWRHHLILMNGNDYSHRRRLPRITVDVSQFTSSPFLLTVTSDHEGSHLFLNGRPAKSRSDFQQSVPVGGRLVLGNSVYGKNPWSGVIQGLVFHRQALEEAVVSERAAQWIGNSQSKSGDLGPEDRWARQGTVRAKPAFIETALVSEHAPWIAYGMDGSQPHSEPDRSGHGHDLSFPPGTTFLSRIILSRDLQGGLLEQLSSRDAVLNYFGFIPFGWLLAKILVQKSQRSTLLILLAVTVAGFSFSLSIELIQTWMPPRSSSLLDLVLNTAGTSVGAALGLLTTRSRRF